MKPRHSYATALLLLVLAAGLPLSVPSAAAQSGSRSFPETGKTVQGRFLDYWQTHGGLAQQGYPISEEMQEKSDTDGKTYMVQYFERAVFEKHPENKAPNDVLLSLLGTFLYSARYPAGAQSQQPNTSAGSVLFKETGKRLGGVFLDYWQTHGGLAQQGFPISDEFTEKSDLDGKTYTVQYFERAVFEKHPENKPPYDILLSQLGTFRYRAKYGQSQPTPAPGIIPTPVAGCTSNLAPGVWQGPFDWQFTLTSDSNLSGNGSLKAGLSLDVACDGTFTGTATTQSYNAEGRLLISPVLTCTEDKSKEPTADFTGKVVPMQDGLHLVIPGGTWRRGTIICNSPLTPNAPQVQDLTGQSIAPADIKVETVSEGKITGSQWLADPALEAIKEKVHTILPNAQINVTSTGHWELDHQQTNTP